MNRCHELMNEGLNLHKTKSILNMEKAIEKYKLALKHVPENGRISYRTTGFTVSRGNNIRSEIYTHIAYAYHDLGDVKNANRAYETAIKYNPDNKDAHYDKKMPHGLRASTYNIGVSGIAQKYNKGESLMPVIISEEDHPQKPSDTRIRIRSQRDKE